MKELQLLIEELDRNGESVEGEIAKAERRLKMLRGLRGMFGGAQQTKPRTRKKKPAEQTAAE